MPLKICVGLSRKVGQPDFGSLGASCSIEAELDASVLGDQTEVWRRLRELYSTCADAVHEELARQQGAPWLRAAQYNETRRPIRQANGKSHNGRAGRGNPPASASQLRALRVLANRQGVDLGALIVERFRVSSPDDITQVSASKLIKEFQRGSVADR